MTAPQAALLTGNRLHLQHGPIDLVIGADGDHQTAFDAAYRRFSTVLEELAGELPLLRRQIGAQPSGVVARRMYTACLPHSDETFVTPMAAVAGSVADEILHAMTTAAPLSRAYVNNGGDIAIWLTENATFRVAMSDLGGTQIGQIDIGHQTPARGIATSGRGGRSLSMGIADSVTVLARDAASADVAATLLGNAVNLPDHPAITRVPARDLQPDSDLGARPVVTDVDELSSRDITQALSSGATLARDMQRRGLIHSAALSLRGDTRIIDNDTVMPTMIETTPNTKERIPLHARG